ncbi:hypothetical protein FRC0022_01674 [Corynebacterium diphtheriae]|nr:hypothetical protein FRC0022_01674 [Corynebacterium diphtheriae]CAB0949181.1 hypothetical protein FRC0477_00922 [Corynebacterium diphtheriae]
MDYFNRLFQRDSICFRFHGDNLFHFFCIVVVKYLDVIFLLLEVRVDILCFIFYKFAISEKSSI